MQVSLNSMLEKNGVSVSSGMSAEKLLALFTKVPQYLSLFPVVSSAVSTLQVVLNTLNKAKETLSKMESALDSAEKALTKAQQTQTFIASQAKPISASPGSPCAPDVATGIAVQSALTIAQQGVDTAKQNVIKAADAVLKAEEAVKEQINKVVKKVFGEKVDVNIN